jgi:serine protein kinase
MSDTSLDIKSFIGGLQDLDTHKKFNWEGTFQQYVDIVRQKPEVTRNAFQRLYDLIVGYGTEEYVEFKKKIVTYKFFQDPFDNGKDAIFGLDVHLMKLVNTLKAAAQGYGPEKRVILLHGPVGSSKSTCARVIKKGVETYSKTDAGAMYTFKWKIDDPALQKRVLGGSKEFPSPMHEEPLKLIPHDARKKFCGSSARRSTGDAKRATGSSSKAISARRRSTSSIS